MTYYSGCDVHRDYSVFVGIDGDAQVHGPTRVDHGTGELEEHLGSIPENTPVAIETSGHWYWIANTIEAMGHRPRLTNAERASRMMGTIDKTDTLDAQGLAMLQKTGTLPEVWIPDGVLRDHRELLRFRMKLVQSKTRWKNRSQALLMKHGVSVSQSDAFGESGREKLKGIQETLPDQARRVLVQQLEMIDQLEERIETVEGVLEEILEDSRPRTVLQTMPGIGSVLSAMLVLEIGDVQRFPGPGHLASYAGVVPGVHASGGNRTDTGLRTKCHQTLKWGFMEAANAVIRHQEAYSESRLIQKYRRLAPHKPSGVPKGAVARMLAESAYWVLTKNEPYEEPDGWSPPS
jgi:transposase